MTVAVRADERGVETVVRDTGRGIAPEHLSRVFEPFFTTRGDGTGLGLAVVRSIAAAHGGDVTLESTPGTGTAARVRVPAAMSRLDGLRTGEWAASLADRSPGVEPAPAPDAMPGSVSGTSR